MSIVESQTLLASKPMPHWSGRRGKHELAYGPTATNSPATSLITWDNPTESIGIGAEGFEVVIFGWDAARITYKRVVV